jgi:hypothetical protein
MSATTIHSTDNTTKAQFLAPGTHQRADAKGKGKGQGALPANRPRPPRAEPPRPAASVEDEAFAAGDLVLIPLSRLVPSAFNVRKSGGEDVSELAALIKARACCRTSSFIPTKPSAASPPVTMASQRVAVACVRWACWPRPVTSRSTRTFFAG